MAKTKAAEGNGSLAIGEVPSTTALAPVSGDELGSVLDGLDIQDDGLSEIGQEDIKLPTKVWNFKGLDQEGNPIPANVFYDTVTEQLARTLDLILIKLHKTNEWREYVQGEGRSRIRCRSFDQVTGTMEDGTVRPCEGCPDAKWLDVIGDDGKSRRNRKCGPVYNIFGAELATRQPCVLRFKKTSLPAIQSYLNKHHIGRRIIKGARSNWPLYVYVCRATLKMSDDKKYAVPVLERREMLSREDIAQGAATVKYVNEVLLGELGKVMEADGDGAGDTSFDPSKWPGDDTKDFVDE
jgi:hypothetical protein